MIKFLSSVIAAVRPLAIRTLQIHVGLLVLCMLAPALAMWSVASNSVLLVSTIGNFIWIVGMCGVGLGLAFGIDYLIRQQIRRSRSLPLRVKAADLPFEVQGVLNDILQEEPGPQYYETITFRLESLLEDLRVLRDGTSAQREQKTAAEMQRVDETAAQLQRSSNIQLAS